MTGNNVNFCFLKLILDKSGKIDISSIITLIWGLNIFDYFFLSL